MSQLRVHILRFSSPQALQRAFANLNDDPGVESCVVESEVCQIRFVAERGASDALVARLYDEGGLTWCSRHPFDAA
jgi:hypothetical protein